MPIREFSLIAKNYTYHGSFLFDMIAILPINEMIIIEGKRNVIWNKILRMLRIFRIKKLLDI